MRKIFAAVVFGLLLVAPAAARDIPAGGLTPDEVVDWLHASGYSATIEYAKDGKPRVMTAYGGHHFGVYFFDCNGPRCGSMQFSMGFDTKGAFDKSRMNDWNRDNRWARGYFDNEGDPWVEYDVDLTPGGTYEMLDDEFAIYRKMLDRFVAQYGL